MGLGKAKYNIKAICTLLGIQPGTLRAWERRYNIIEPIRNESGHRLYSDEHVAVLRWLLDKVNKGFTIGQAVGLLENGNINLEAKGEVHHINKQNSLAMELEEYLLTFQESKANRVLDEAFSIFSVEFVAMNIISQVLINVGEKWEQKEISVAHEHYVTQYLKTRIMIISHLFQTDRLLPKAVAICAGNERHELGLLIFTLFLRQKGYEVIYLGPNVPTEDVKIVIKEIDAKYLFVSCTLVSHLPATVEVVRELGSHLPELTIGLGGNAFRLATKRNLEQLNKYFVGFTKEEWEEWL